MKWTYLFLVLLGCNSAFSTIVRLEALPEMSANADVIAHVVVGDKVSRKEAGGRTVELSSVEVLDPIKGTKKGEILTIYQVNGIVGQSRFSLGEEIVIFGMRHRGMIVSYGVGLGKFRVLREGNKTAVVEDLHSLLTMEGEPKARRYPSLTHFMAAIDESLHSPWRVVPVGPKRRKK